MISCRSAAVAQPAPKVTSVRSPTLDVRHAAAVAPDREPAPRALCAHGALPPEPERRALEEAPEVGVGDVIAQSA